MGAALEKKMQTAGPETVEAAYRKHRSRLLLMAGAIVGERNLAEDVVHDVFSALLRQPRLPEEPARAAAYLTSCVRNRSVSVIRGRHSNAVQADDALAEMLLDTQADPAERTAQAEEDGMLLELVARLGEEERETVALRIWGEMEFREIAALQGVSKSTAHARYAQAVERLRLGLERGASNG